MLNCESDYLSSEDERRAREEGSESEEGSEEDEGELEGPDGLDEEEAVGGPALPPRRPDDQPDEEDADDDEGPAQALRRPRGRPSRLRQKSRDTGMGLVQDWVLEEAEEVAESCIFGKVGRERLVLGYGERREGEEGLSTLPWSHDRPMLKLNRSLTTDLRFRAMEIINWKAKQLAQMSGSTKLSVGTAQAAAAAVGAANLKAACEQAKGKAKAKAQAKRARTKKGKGGGGGEGDEAPAVKKRKRAASARDAAEMDDLKCSFPWERDGTKQRYTDAYRNATGIPLGGPRGIDAEVLKDEFRTFLELFPTEIIDLMTTRTNRKARGCYGEVWKLTCREEMLTFLGVHFFLYVGGLPNKRQNWSSCPFASDFVKEMMPRRRYEQISSVLTMGERLEDLEPGLLRDSSSRTGADGKPTKVPVDHGFKMATAMRMFSNAWTAKYNPSPNIAVDEGSVAFTGRWRYKLSVKAKPYKSHIRFWALGDSLTNYQMRFVLSTSTESLTLGKQLGTASAAVLELLEHNNGYPFNFYHRGMTLYCDNFYTSPQLAEYLRTKGVYMVGSLRSGSGDVPASFTTLLSDSASPLLKEPRGSTVVYSTPAMEIFVCMDSKPVGFVSTLPHLTSRDMCVVKRKRKGHKEPLSILVPAALGQYNRFMGAIDVGDRLAANLRRKEHNATWSLALLNRLLRVTLGNAFVLWRQANAASARDTSVSRYTLLVAERLLRHYGKPYSLNSVSVARALQKALPGVRYSVLHRPQYGCKRYCAYRLPHTGGELCRKGTKTSCSSCLTKLRKSLPLCPEHFWVMHEEVLKDAGKRTEVGGERDADEDPDADASAGGSQ